MAFKQREVAEITVNGMNYRDWESVLVRDAEMESSDFFEFTCSEGMPFAKDWAAVRIRPGDRCTVKLAGQLAITGFVETRQVSYNENSHGIKISGHSNTRLLTYGAAQTKTNEFKDKSYKEIANTVTKPFGVQFKPVGNVSEKKFERYHIPPGETAWNVLESLARMRGIVLGSDTEGNLTGRTMFMPTGDSLIEGVNILEGHEVMSMNGGGAGGDDDKNPVNLSTSQQTGNDQRWGAKSAHDPSASNSNSHGKVMGGNGGTYSPKRTLAEVPGDKKDLGMRNKMENERAGVEQLTVDIVVQGWLKPSGGLWKAGDKCHVKSPMLIVDEELKIMKVEFTQDSKSGTRTSINLVRDTGDGVDDSKHPVNLDPNQSSTGGAQDASDPSGGIPGHSPA
jgi:prophage tail gpP-like protein